MVRKSAGAFLESSVSYQVKLAELDLSRASSPSFRGLTSPGSMESAAEKDCLSFFVFQFLGELGHELRLQLGEHAVDDRREAGIEGS